jgi:hypothetical protein
LEAAAFAVGDDVDPLTGAEELEARMCFGSGGAFFEAELLDEALRRRAGFLEAAEVRLGNALFLLIVETDLEGGVAVFLHGLDLEDGVARDVDDDPACGSKRRVMPIFLPRRPSDMAEKCGVLEAWREEMMGRMLRCGS